MWFLCAVVYLPLQHVYAEQRVNLQTSIRVDGLYDSNIFLSENEPQAEFLTVLTPEIATTLLLRIGQLDVGYGLSAFLPTKNFNADDLHKVFHDAYVVLLSQLTERFEIEVSDTLTTVGGDISRPDFQISNVFDVHTASVELRYRMPLSQRTETNFEIGGLRTDVFGFFSDYFAGSVEVDLRRQMTPRFQGGLRSRAVSLLFDSSNLQDVIIYGVDLWGEYALSRRLLLRIPLGFQYLSQPQRDDDITFSLDAKLVAELTPRSKLTFGATRGFTVDVTGNSFDRWEFLLEYVAELNSKIELSGRAKYFQYNQDVVSLLDDATTEAGMEIAYRLRPNLRAVFGGRLFFNHGDLTINDFDVFQGFLGIKYDFTKGN